MNHFITVNGETYVSLGQAVHDLGFVGTAIRRAARRLNVRTHMVQGWPYFPESALPLLRADLESRN
jgi:hypothetical protein